MYETHIGVNELNSQSMLRCIIPCRFV